MVNLHIFWGKAGLKLLLMFSLRLRAKRRPPSLKRISAVPESIGSAGQSPTINGFPEENSVIFLRFFRLKICSRCIPPFMKRISLNSLILSMPKCANTSLIPTSSVSARFMAARRQSLPSEASDDDKKSDNTNIVLYASGIRNSSDLNARKNRYSALKSELGF